MFSYLVSVFFLATSLHAPAALAKEDLNGKSYLELENISEESPVFVDALLELQKIHFKTQNWDRFFSYSLFYRKKIMADEKDWQTNFRGRFYALEILALAKHCMTDMAEKVAVEGILIAKKLNSPERTSLEDTLIFVSPLKTLPQVRGTIDAIHIPESVFKETNHWPIQARYLQEVRHPKVLRVKVKSRCENEK